MGSIGERLRLRRLESGTPLEEVAKKTKIGTRLLEAIEAGQFDQLPGGVFRKSFVMQYAAALGFAEGEFAEELKRHSAFDELPRLPGEGTPLPGVHMPAIKPDRDFSGLWRSAGSLVGVVVVVGVCAAVYGWFQKPAAPPIQPAPAQAPAVAVQPPPAVMAANVPANVPAEVAATQLALQVGLTAGEETWIQVSSDGKPVFTSALHANESKLIEASEIVQVLVG
ncbi:MAG: helix-turn-helix domain-containing protein, partial [Gammaproteobacteria bacterium]